MKRFTCLFFSFILIFSAAFSIAHTEQEEDIPPSLSISVQYDRPMENGFRGVWVTVSCDPGSTAIDRAEGVTLTLKAHERIQFSGISAPYEISVNPDGSCVLELHDIASGSSQECSFHLMYQYEESRGRKYVHQHLDENGDVVRPWWSMVADSSNCGSCVYTCELDVEPIPRAVCVGWDIDHSTPAIPNDVDLLNGAFGASFFNGNPVTTYPEVVNYEFDDLAALLDSLDPDDNDITYIYVNAHGAANHRDHFFALHQGYKREANGKMIDASNLVNYNDLIKMFSKLNGRVVILLEICFSGNAIGPAEEYLDQKRMAMMTSVNDSMSSGAYPSYGWFANDLAKIAGTGGYPDWETVLVQEPAHETVLTTMMGPVLYAAAKVTGIVYSAFEQQDAITLGDVYIQEGKRTIEITMGKAEMAPLILISGIYGIYIENSFDNFIDPITTGLSPMIVGNSELPVFVKNAEYDDGKVILAVKSEDCYSVPPEAGHAMVVFSYDEPEEWSGYVVMYMLNEEGHLITESGGNAEDWKFRSLLTVPGYGFRPAPLEDTGGLSTRLYAEYLPDGRILVQMDVGVDGMGANDPHCLSYYKIYRTDYTEGLQVELFGVREAWYPQFGKGDLEAYECYCTLNDEKCDEETLLAAFREYGIEFERDGICISEGKYPRYEVVPRAFSPEGVEALKDIRSSVVSELPPTYDELEAEYGLD